METTDRARTPLLTLITSEALDRDYQVAASKRVSRGGDGSRVGRSRVAVVLVVATFAMLVTVAAVQTSQNAAVDNASRTSLIERIEARRATVADLQQQIAELRRDNSSAERALRSMGSALGDTQTRQSELGAMAGFEPVIGDGVRVTLDSAADAGDSETLRDSDLALLVDALWSAGAEAIAINGQRLTAVSAVRTSGDAIEVNAVGVAPPYTVSAIGNQRTLSANFVETDSGLRFLALAEQYGFGYEMDNVDRLRLPAAPEPLRVLRSATPIRSPLIEGGGPP